MYSSCILQFIGKWYEVERTFYLPEIASSCTELTFNQDTDRSIDFEKTLKISINSINHWTGSPSQNVGIATRESPTSSIMDFQVGRLLKDNQLLKIIIFFFFRSLLHVYRMPYHDFYLVQDVIKFCLPIMIILQYFGLVRHSDRWVILVHIEMFI